MVSDVMCTISKNPQTSNKFILHGMTFPALPQVVVNAASAEAGLSVGICLWFIHQQLSLLQTHVDFISSPKLGI